MNRSTAIALILTGLAVPAVAQHGGGHGGGFGGGHAAASHAGPAFHSGFSAPARSSGYGQRFSGSRPPVSPNSSMAFRRGPAIHYGAQPLNYGAQRVGGTQGDRRSPYRSPYREPRRGGIVYENPGFSSYYLGYPYGLGYYGDYGFDDDGYDDSSDAGNAAVGSEDGPDYGPPQYNGFDPQAQGGAVPQTQSWPQNQGNTDQGNAPDPSQGMAQLEPGTPYRPYYGAPHPVSPVAAQPVVTLVFKDHRPNQQIRNYLINGDTLTVWDQHPHEITLDELDIAATEKLNHDAGVDLYLPRTTQ
jgi:hypothetical protein